ncbi:MAG: ATP synthase F0 subunit B [Candidatus Eremiobacteraeota bacterium]|nr:ATP synthase F0 subunit B [Candidatus Eremiobacteraeota bacterium]MBV9263367.1 ATP synthase F0 subunit B [Candidatus Eremiobacteraeota bacterium]
MFLSLDGTLVVQLINFAIFFALLSVVFLRPVGRAIAQRRAYIDDLVSDYDRYQEQARNLREEAEAIRADARRKAEQHVAAARAAASNDAAEASSRYVRQAQDISEEAQRTAAAQLGAARAGEPEAVRKLADLMLERVIPEAAP